MSILDRDDRSRGDSSVLGEGPDRLSAPFRHLGEQTIPNLVSHVAEHGEFLFVEVAAQYLGPFPRKTPRGRAAQSSARAGNEGHFVFEPHRFLSSFRDQPQC